MSKYAIAIHGGAGTIRRTSMTPTQEQEYRKGLQEALDAGRQLLAQGGSALDAVEKAVQLLEDFPLFNAGRGSVFTNAGKNEMDASIMCGRTLQAGAVAGVSNVRNPIELARRVMDRSKHVMLAGKGAEDFARRQNLAFEPDAYFFSQHRYDQWMKIRESDKAQLDHSEDENKKFGTVGAVALDVNGHLAAATSTGGLTNKKYGRIGDSPVIGAGTYANDRTCAVSCTGDGEYFIRAVAAYDVSCLMEYKGLSLKEACAIVVHEKLVKIGGDGGLIAVDRSGQLEMPFNSEGMYRGMANSEGNSWIGIYK